MIFVNSNPMVSKNNYSYEVPYDGLATAIYESNCEWETFRGDQEVIIANMYENWILDNNHTEEEKQAVYEGVLSDIWENIKKFFIAIANKIKSWFNSVIKYFKTTFMDDEKFIAKYKDEIEERDDENFSFQAHKWDLSVIDTAKGICKQTAEGVKKWRDDTSTFDELIKKLSDQEAGSSEKFYSGIQKNDKGNYGENYGHNFEEKAKEITSNKIKTEKKAIENLWGSFLKGEEFAGNISKLQTALAKKINGGEKKQCKSFSSGKSLGKEAMIEVVENKSDKLDDIKEISDYIEDLAKDTSDWVDKIVSSYAKDENTNKDKAHVKKIVQCNADVTKHGLNVLTGACKTCEEQYRACIHECSQILRTFARHTSKAEKEANKESYNRYRAGRSVSLLENWF